MPIGTIVPGLRCAHPGYKVANEAAHPSIGMTSTAVLNFWCPEASTDTVDRSDVSIIAADREGHVIFARDQRVGRIEAPPSGSGAAPHHDPRMHGVGALNRAEPARGTVRK